MILENIGSGNLPICPFGNPEVLQILQDYYSPGQKSEERVKYVACWYENCEKRRDKIDNYVWMMQAESSG